MVCYMSDSNLLKHIQLHTELVKCFVFVVVEVMRRNGQIKRGIDKRNRKDRAGVIHCISKGRVKRIAGQEGGGVSACGKTGK